ncbi:MAG TPA: outer membrane beta-barrel protein [Cellvibrio sp.]|nr:outer membrane beta-barrel protein [Cellvibrio sp.]
MKKLITAPLFFILGSMPLMSWAGSESGLYIGGSIGQSSVEDNRDLGDVSFNVDDDDNGYKIFFGYNFGVLPLLDLGIEANYRDYGTFKEGGAEVSLDSAELFGIIGLTLGPVGLFGKVGYSDTSIDKSFDALDDIDFNNSDSATAYGVGAKMSFGAFGLRAEYEELDIDELDDASMVSVGATYTF